MMNKKIILTCLLLLSVLLLVQGAAAQLTVPGAIQIGDDNTDVSNPLAQNNGAKDVIQSVEITITNNFTADTLNNLRADVNTVNGFDIVDLNVSFDFEKTDLDANESTKVTVTSRLPEDLDSIDNNFVENAFQVANIVFKADKNGNAADVETGTSQLKMQRENKLVVREVEFCINERCETLGRSEDTVDRNVAPGDLIGLKIKVENLFNNNDDEDLDIDDVDVAYEVDDDKFDEDDSENIGALNAEADQEESFTIGVDREVDAGSYELLVSVVGIDENAATHGELKTIKFDVERKTHDLAIVRPQVNPQTLLCGKDFTANFQFTVENKGQRDEDRTRVSVSNNELSIVQRQGPFAVDEQQDRAVTIPVTLPKTTLPGNYVFLLKTFFENTAQSDEESITLTVPNCDAKQDAEEDNDDEENTVENKEESTVVQQDTPKAAPSGIRTTARPTSSVTTTKASSGLPGWIVPVFLIIIGAGIIAILALLVLSRR